MPTDTFGNRLVLIRREKHLTVKEAAALCGVHYATWSTWENGTKPGDMAGVVSTISRCLRVRRDWLMWGGPLSGPSDGGGDGVASDGDTHRNLRPIGAGSASSVPFVSRVTSLDRAA